MFDRLDGQNCTNCKFTGECIYTRVEKEEPRNMVGNLRRAYQNGQQDWCISYWPMQKATDAKDICVVKQTDPITGEVSKGKNLQWWEKI
jgi:hypothetical protein